MASKMGWLVWFGLVGLMLGGAFALSKRLHEQIVQYDRPHIRPFRPQPRPPEPSPPPLNDDRRRIFDDLRPHILQTARQAVAEQLQAELKETIDQLKKDPTQFEMVDLDSVKFKDGEPPQAIGILGSLFASAIVGFIWKAVKMIVAAVVGAAILGLLIQFWPWLTAAFVIATSVVSWPIAKAAAWSAQRAATEPKKE